MDDLEREISLIDAKLKGAATKYIEVKEEFRHSTSMR
jgi:hypothetical protein